MGFTINEFPYWSFLFADLHPHMINIPFTLLVLALALNWLRRQPSATRDRLAGGDVHRQPDAVPRSESALALSSARYLWRRIDWGLVLQWTIWPLALGALVPINTWDWPAYAGFSGLVVLFVAVRGLNGLQAAPSRRRSMVLSRLTGGVLLALALAGGSVLLYLPFMSYYTPIFVGLGWSLGRTHTDLGEFLTVWGLFLFVSTSLLLVLLVRQRSRWASVRLLRLIVRYPLRLNRVEELYGLVSGRRARARGRARRRLGVLGGLLLLVLLAWWAWLGYWMLVWMAPLLLLSAVLVFHHKMPDERRYVLALVFTAFLILVGIEFFYLKDHLDGDQMGWWRMNTLFKFYLQVWVMLGIAVGVSLPGLWRAAERWRAGWRWLWSAGPDPAPGGRRALSAVGHSGAGGRPLSGRAPAHRLVGRHGVYDRGHLHLARRKQSHPIVGRLSGYSLAAGQRAGDASPGRGPNRLLSRVWRARVQFYRTCLPWSACTSRSSAGARRLGVAAARLGPCITRSTWKRRWT